MAGGWLALPLCVNPWPLMKASEEVDVDGVEYHGPDSVDTTEMADGRVVVDQTISAQSLMMELLLELKMLDEEEELHTEAVSSLQLDSSSSSLGGPGNLKSLPLAIMDV